VAEVITRSGERNCSRIRRSSSAIRAVGISGLRVGA
jgi:hypothetical protein